MKLAQPLAALFLLVSPVAWALACTDRTVGTGGGGTDSADASDASVVPTGSDTELCDHWQRCAKTSLGDASMPDAALPSASASGATCNEAREARFQANADRTCGCSYANECPGSSCDLETGECADSPRVVCKQYCARAKYVDSCNLENCTRFCAEFLPSAKVKCAAQLAPFLACAEAQGATGTYRCATYILAPSFPVPIACDAAYKATADCVW